jgi:hypothetical protein
MSYLSLDNTEVPQFLATTLIVPFFLGIANAGAIKWNSLLQGLQCPPILQFPFLIQEQCMHEHDYA